jgi:hypothetical protein
MTAAIQGYQHLVALNAVWHLVRFTTSPVDLLRFRNTSFWNFGTRLGITRDHFYPSVMAITSPDVTSCIVKRAGQSDQ